MSGGRFRRPLVSRRSFLTGSATVTLSGQQAYKCFACRVVKA